MAPPGDESVPWDPLSVGATRPAVIRGLNVPFWFILPIVGLPMVIVSVTRNPFWLLMIAGLTLLGRWLVSRDHNRPRVLFLALISGAMFADRRRWGGDSVDPLGEVRRDDLILHVDRHTKRFAPILGHWNDSIFVNQDGSVGVIYHLTGLAAELAGGRAISAAHLSLNQLDRSIAQPRIEWWDHSVRQDGQAMSALPAVDNWFAARFDEAYRVTQGDGKLFRNDHFVTIIMRPEESLRTLVAGGVREQPNPSEIMIQDFEAVLARIEAGLTRYGARRLGVRERNGVVFSEIAEALHLIANGKFRPLGLTTGRMGWLVVPERVVFGHRDFQIVGEGEPVFGAILSFRDYPARTSPTMFAELGRVPFPVTITNAIRFQQKAEALGTIGLRVKQMQSGNDAARSQMLELAQDEDDVMSGRSVYVTHDFSVAIRAPSLEELDRRVAHTQSILSDAGVTGVRETTAIKPAFYGQIPGNRRWWTRPAAIKSINAVAMAPHHDVPRGHDRGRWGAPIVMLRTTADTEYAFHFHVQDSAQIPAEDLGNCMLIGPAGSGKSTLMGSVCLLALRCAGARVVIVDKDQGLSVMVRAAGGSYLVLRSGSPSGLAPLRGLSDSEEDLAFLERFVRGLILADGQGELSAEEDRRLRRAVARQMQMPPAMRGLAGIAVMLGQRATDGAAARLRKWCRDERLGWAFDNESDELRMDARMIGFDTTALLRDDLVCSPTLSYLFYRTRKLINGRPIVLAVDEFWRTDRVPAFRDENNDHLKTIRKAARGRHRSIVAARRSVRAPTERPKRERRLSPMAQARAEVHAEFADALRQAGLRPKGPPIMDGRKHRVAVEGDRRGRLSGTYIGHLDEFPAGYIHNFKTGEEIRWKAAREYPVLAPAERERLKARVAADQAARESARRRREAAVSRTAELVWNRARPVESHPYLIRKDVAAHNVRQDRRGDLLVPMRDADGRLWGLQTIDAEGKKLFMGGGRKQGLHAVLGAPAADEPVVIAEGYATAATMHAVTGLAAIAAFDSGNLLDVARALRERDPARRIVIAADNDHHLPRLAVPLPNVGLEKATAAAEAVSGVVLSPRFATTDKGTDWNDYAAQHGKPALSALAQAELRLHGIELPPAPRTAPMHQSTVAQPGATPPTVTQADRDAARQRLRGGPRTASRHDATQAAAREAARRTARPRSPRPTP